MTKYILDTDTVSYLEDPASQNFNAVKSRVLDLKEEDELCVLPFLFYEIEFGRSLARDEQTRSFFASAYMAAKAYYTVLPFTEKGAGVFGQLKCQYMKKFGMTAKAVNRHNIDLMLAASAIVEKAVLVSNDSIFLVIEEISPDLQFENWTVPVKNL